MKVVTAVVNNPIFIEIQYHTLKRYLKCDDDVEFIVFNDAKDFPDFTNHGDLSIKSQIEELCKKLNIKCINIPNQNHRSNLDAGIRCADSMNYILNYQIQNPDRYLLLDSDMFLIDYFDIDAYSKYDCAVVLQSRNNGQINYFWNGIYYFDMFKMGDIGMLNWSTCNSCDVGGMMQFWLKKQMGNLPMPNTDEIRWTNKTFNTNNIYFIKHLWSCSWDKTELPEKLKEKRELIEFIQNDPRNNNGKYFCEIYDNVFLHYRAGGNWRKEGLNFQNELAVKLKNSIV